MTKTQCLSKMVFIWRYLALNPQIIDKQEVYFNFDLPQDSHQCPCCEYVIQQPPSDGRLNCNLCPLISFWKGEESKYSMFCEAKGSQYHRWKFMDLTGRALAAEEIADYSENLLHQLLKDEPT